MDRFTRWTLAVVAFIVVLAIWTATRPNDAITQLEVRAPAVVTRAWFTALATGRPEEAWELLAPEAQAREARADFLRRHTGVILGRPNVGRTRIDAVAETGDEARVDVARTYGTTWDFPFWRLTVASERVVVRLRLVEERWRITVAPDAP
jgi:hypothetical protein